MNEPIKVRGKIIKFYDMTTKEDAKAEISLTPQELAEQLTYEEILRLSFNKFGVKDPQPPQDKDLKKLCEATQDGTLKEMFKGYCSCLEPLYPYKKNKPPFNKLCGKCKLPLPPAKIEIEKLDYVDLCICDYGDTDKIIEHIITLAKKVNEVIRLIREDK